MKYDDMLSLPYPFKSDRPRMSRVNRAAQFSPFAALTGYDDAVRETARLTETRPELDDEQKAAINEVLSELARRAPERPEAEIVFFQPDERKAGGRYATKRGHVRRIDEVNREIFFADGERVAMETLVSAAICRKND